MPEKTYLALGLLSAVAISHCIFLAVVLLTLSSKLSNRLAAVLVLLLAIRIGKSVAGLIFTGAAYEFSAAGLLAMALAGPILFFLLKSLFELRTVLSGGD